MARSVARKTNGGSAAVSGGDEGADDQGDAVAGALIISSRRGSATGDERAGAPPARSCVVLFWRDRDLDTRHAEASPLELAVLHAVHAGLPIAAAAARVGASVQDLDETVADLHGAGILLGARAIDQGG